MRIVLQNQAIFTSARLTFIAIDQDVFRTVRLLRNKSPFHAGRKTGAATPPQTGRLDLINNVIGLHLERLLDSLIPIQLQVAIDVRSALAKALRDNFDLVGMGN